MFYKQSLIRPTMIPKSYSASSFSEGSRSMFEQSQTPPPFEKSNTLLCRDTPPSHKIVNLGKKEQNIELIFVVVSKQSEIKTKNHTIIQCLIADESASILMNFFNETGSMIQEGDIIYASGIYLSTYRDMSLLYQGAMSIIKRVGRHFFRFNLNRNISLESLEASKLDSESSSNNFKKL